MANKTFFCENCGKKHIAPANMGKLTGKCVKCNHTFCADTGNMAEDVRSSAPIIRCRSCESELFVPANVGSVRILCPVCSSETHCDTDHLPTPAPVQETVVRFCQHCGQKMNVPRNKGMLRVTCPNPSCGKQFNFNSDTIEIVPDSPVKNPAAPPAPQKPAEPPKPVTPPAPPPDPYNGRTRTLRFIYWAERIGHTLDPLANLLSKGSNLNIFDDGQQIGSMKSQGATTIEVNPGEHRLSIGFSLSGGLLIPANDQNYLLLVNKEGMSYSLAAIPEYDPFYEALEEFFLGMCQKGGLRDRILMRNNRNNNLHLMFHSDRVVIEWDLAQTQGIKQWATGRDGETIYYANVIPHKPPTQLPGNYWIAVRMLIANAINEKSQAYQCSPNGIITLKTIGNLY